MDPVMLVDGMVQLVQIKHALLPLQLLIIQQILNVEHI
jgi:hypothetical protein